MKAGNARIVRADKYNVAVEVLNEVTNPKTKETRLEWQEQGYYGHRLKWAAESALYESMPIGEPITPQMIRDAVERIVEATKAHLGATA